MKTQFTISSAYEWKKDGEKINNTDSLRMVFIYIRELKKIQINQN